jgi:hypothetical protein
MLQQIIGSIVVVGVLVLSFRAVRSYSIGLVNCRKYKMVPDYRVGF